MARFDENIQNVRGSIANLAVKVHGGPGSGRYPKGSGKADNLTDTFGDHSKFLENSEAWALENEKKLPEEVINYGKQAEGYDALNHYTHTHYERINDYLRHGEDIYNPITGMEWEIPAIDKIISNSPTLPEGLVMWRGVGSDSGKRLAEAKIGDICVDKAFQSHTLSLKTANEFARQWQPLPRPEADKIPHFTLLPRPEADKIPHFTLVRAITKGVAKGVFVNNMMENEVLVERNRGWEVIDKQELTNFSWFKYHIVTVAEP